MEDITGIIKTQAGLIQEKTTNFHTVVFLSALVFILIVVVLACKKTIRRYKKENAELKFNSRSTNKKESAQSIKVRSGTWGPYFLKEGDIFNFYIGRHAGGKLNTCIGKAKKSIKILSPYLSVSTVNEIRAKRSSGLADIAIITSASPENLKNFLQVNALKELISNSKKENGKYEYTANFKSVFFKHNFFHAKLYIIDDEIVFVGSINFTRKGMEESHETCLTIKDTDTVKGLVEYYNGLFAANLDKWNVAELGKKIYTFHRRKPTDEKKADSNAPA